MNDEDGIPRILNVDCPDVSEGKVTKKTAIAAKRKYHEFSIKSSVCIMKFFFALWQGSAVPFETTQALLERMAFA